MDSDKSAQVSLLKNRLKETLSEIKAIVEQGRLVTKDHSQLYLFKGMFRELKPYFDCFNDIWNRLIEIYTLSGLPTDFPNERENEFQVRSKRYYYEACAIYESFMNPTPVAPLNEPSVANTAMTSGNLNDSRTVRARLPQINLPQFSGVQADWPLFRDTYMSLIHEEVTLSNIEKFHFLVSCLRGPALSLVRGVPLQEANYDQAWRILRDNYDDKRRLAGGYLKTILNYTPFKHKPTASGLKNLITTVLESVVSFKQLGIREADDFILTYLVLRCLDPATRMDFERKVSGIEFPKFDKLMDIIKSECRSLELTGDDARGLTARHTTRTSTGLKQEEVAFLVEEGKDERTEIPSLIVKSRNFNRLVCPVCGNNHTLYDCRMFKNSPPEKKRAQLEDWSGCLNCLSSKHKVDVCKSARRCQTCDGKHHSWLHIAHTDDASQPDVHQTAALGGTSRCREVILGTALVRMKDRKGKFQTVRLVADSGSQHSFITRKCARRLGLEFVPETPRIAGIGQVQLPRAYGVLPCIIRPRLSDEEFSTYAIVVPNITGSLPHSLLPNEMREHLNVYDLADPSFWIPQEIDFLLGADLYFEVITGAPLTIGEGLPKVIPSRLGHIVAGRCKGQGVNASQVSLFVSDNTDLPTIMSRFWEIEELPKHSLLSSEELACEEHFKTNHYRLPCGRYVVGLPFKASINELKIPKEQVTRRFLNQEHRLIHRPTLRNEYGLFMNEYLELRHMQPALSPTRYLIPHHSVVKERDGKLKLRVVFDASCRGPGGSLNDHLMVGPKLQRDITDIVTSFRTHCYVLVADIVKMYRQIMVRPADRPYQHILWRADSKDELMTMQLNTVTYGVNSSSFLAVRTLFQLVEDAGQPYPLASKTIKKCSYMDDFVTGANTVEEAMLLRDELIQLLRLGGFELDKWRSNCPEILGCNQSVAVDGHLSLTGNENSECKVLGLKWLSSKDIFVFDVQRPSPPFTKRGILSSIARIYDPLGFLAPVVFKAKIMLQDVWRAKCDWDDHVPSNIGESWSKFAEDLPTLARVRIARHVGHPNPSAYHLVGFSDASQRGYSAALYLRTCVSGDTQIHLLKAKTKLASAKLTSIPRLELCGALLLAQLLESCRAPLEELSIQGTFLFTDSTVVLGWLNIPLNQLKSFVAHRVFAILEIVPQASWHYVSSEANPADCASRGLMPHEILNHDIWWTGPSWLLEPPNSWPLTVIDYTCMELPETKPATTVVLLTEETSSIINWMNGISCYWKLIHSFCLVMRFINKARKLEACSGPISLGEIEEARLLCIQLVQTDYLVSKENVKNAKHWKSLMPFQDSRGIFRVGGRLTHSSLPYSTKYPIILPDSHFTRLLIDYYHRSYLHVGPTALRAALQSRYYIISARKMIRSRLRRCVKCQMSAPRTQAPIMGNLPPCRLDEGKIFQHVGVDFGGPFLIKESSRRKAALGKAYLCLFVCMVTKALHLEVVTSCSTEAFIAALNRFISRRGIPKHIYSDCGTNFMGASSALGGLRKWFSEQATQRQIQEYTAQNEIRWHFNPPHSPHFGGLWEAGVKSAKSLLAKNLINTPFTYEELATIFSRIEAILNSRPLCPMEEDVTSMECLTPGHFLIGRPLTALPEEDLLDCLENKLSRWQLVQQRVQHFWKQWRLNYLNQLQQRRKWTANRSNLTEGELVIVKDFCSPPTKWPLARVIAVHPGPDGVVRVATIQTPRGSFKRPAIKLVPLLLPNHESI